MSSAQVSSYKIGGLVTAATVLLALAWSQLNLTYDLGFFLPTPTNHAQQLLIERLGQGPGTQLTFAVLPDTNDAEVQRVATELRKQSGITRVLPESNSPTIEALPAVIWENRLLLGDLPLSVEEWRAVLEERSMDAMLADEELLSLIAADPGFTSLAALESATSATVQPTFQNKNEHFLLIQTAGGVFDLDRQASLIANIRETLLALDHPNAELYGSGVYGIDLQASVQRESILFSLLASLSLAALVFFRFRSTKLVIAIGVPLFVGGACALGALALLFTEVHGITLAFGFTLLGVAIDYPLHLLSHNDSITPRSIWPTLLLGIASTLIAYCAFVVSGTQGMQQLGVFATAGIVGAAGSAFFLAHSEPSTAQLNLKKEKLPVVANFKLTQLPWLACLALCSIVLFQQSLFSDSLGEMTPVPKSTLQKDAELRATMGVTNLRYIVSVRAADESAVLRSLEQIHGRLDKARENALITGYQSVGGLLPSTPQIAHRKKRIGTLLANGNFDTALAESDFHPDAFQPFKAQLKATLQQLADPEQQFLTVQRLKDQSPELSNMLDSLIYKSPEGSTVALVYLSGLREGDASAIAKLDASVSQIAGTTLVDLKAASETLVRDYRDQVFFLLGSALSAIALVLLTTTRSPKRVVWMLGTVSAAIGVSVSTNAILLGGLSLFDVIALALVAGLGLDYALFFSREEKQQPALRAIERAVTLCALSSLLVFGILGLSNVPLLQGLGVTVASGVLAAYALARWGRRSGLLSGE